MWATCQQFVSIHVPTYHHPVLVITCVRSDVELWYDEDLGNPAATAQGAGYVVKLLARLYRMPITTSEFGLNTTPLHLPARSASIHQLSARHRYFY